MEITLPEAIKEVIKKANFFDGIVKGLHESAKVLDSGNAQVCFFAEDCQEPTYAKLVKALCSEHQVPLLTIPTKVDLGEMVGLCKFDPEGRPRKVVGCSCAVIKDFGEESDALKKLQEHIDSSRT